MAYFDNPNEMASRLADIRSRQADRKRSADSRTAMFHLNVGPNFAGALGATSAPFSGYLDERDYLDGLNDDNQAAELQNTLKGGAPRTISARQTAGLPPMAPMRPSFAALRDPNLDTPEPTFEQRRQAGVIAGQDARIGRELEDDRQRNRANFDIGSGQSAAREQGIGDIRRTQALEDARNAADIYQDPKVKQVRNQTFYDDMEKLRARYADPTIQKGINDAEVARLRGLYGVERESVRGQYGTDQTAAKVDSANRNADVRANATIGGQVAASGGDPTSYRPGYDPAKVMSEAELNSFAADQGVDINAARALARSHGYTITPR